MLDLGDELVDLARVAPELDLRLVVLFGSHAHGRPVPGPESDLDIAVRTAGADGRARFWPIRRALTDVFTDRSLDLVILDGSDHLLRWEVMRDGVLLYGDTVEFLEYRAYAYRDFVDSADLRELEHALFLRKLACIGRAIDASS